MKSLNTQFTILVLAMLGFTGIAHCGAIDVEQHLSAVVTGTLLISTMYSLTKSSLVWRLPMGDRLFFRGDCSRRCLLSSSPNWLGSSGW